MVDSSELHRPPDEWPLLLAGPILRRVTECSVAVFIATCKRVLTATLTVYEGVGSGRQVLRPQTPGARPTVALGEFLHVCVVKATGLALEPGHLYGYDLELETESGTTDLLGETLLSEPVPLGYNPGDLPGFVLPGSLDTLRVVHASCRKPHGCENANLTDPDALPLVDRFIKDRRADPWNRPHQLFLTGDQIYADEVPAALLAALTSAGNELLFWSSDEQLPDRAGGVITDPDLLDPGVRSKLLDAQGVKDRPPDADPMKWDSDYAASHLLFFGEWCAMYLFAWSPELWARAADVPGSPKVPDAFYYYLPPASIWAPPGEANTRPDPRRAPDTTTPALIYAQHLPFVRRALANVATYMVFDDHDVTDDWFLNAKTSEQQRGTPLGRRLMRNALAAYAVFQHWGNVPEAFDPGTPGGRLLELLNASASGTPPIGQADQLTAADEILDVGAQPVGPDRKDDRLRWDYELVFSEHRLIVLDTRTWRAYPAGHRPVLESEVLDADEERVDLTDDWGPERLEAVAAAWADAAGAVPLAVEVFLLAGADTMSSAAVLARIGDARTGDFATAARNTLSATALLLDSVADGPGTAGQPSAWEWLEAAREAVGSSDYAPGPDLVESVLRVATAMYEAVFILREGQAAWLAEVGLDSVGEEALAYLFAVEMLAEMLEDAAAFLQGAVHSTPRAARHADALVVAWGTLAYDCQVALWGATDAEAAEVALDSAARQVAELRARLAATSAAFAAADDPVWALVNEADRRAAAELISAEALVFQVQERVSDPDSDKPLTLVISPTPVFGHALVEIAQRDLVARDTKHYPDLDIAEETWDHEPWSGNQPALTRFLDALAPLESIVLLSGDVHYAFSSVTDYMGGGGRRARFVQLTSSSVKNAFGPSKMLAAIDESREAHGESILMPLDYLETLPTQAVWETFSPAAQGLIPSREQVQAAMEEQRDAIEDPPPDPAGTWWTGGFDIPGLGTVLEDTGAAPWDELNEDTASRTAGELDGVAQGWEDPSPAFTGDRVHSSPLAQEPLLAFGDAAGVDPRLLPEQRTTILRDRRAEARAADSPGLEARLAARPFTNRWALVRMARTTVGHANIGVVTIRDTSLGRFIVHELHWFPIDALDHQLQPNDAVSFRDDWIITRHCGGLIRGTPADGSLVGACGPAAPVIPEVWLRIDVTSPGQTGSGSSGVHVITEAAPTMPDITVQARLVGVTPQAEAAQAREVRLTCSYVEGTRNDVVHVPGPTADDWVALAPGRTSWRPSFPDFCGGELRVHARADFGGALIEGDTGLLHVILGRNPAKAEIRAEAELRAEADAGTNIEVVFHRESSFTQFAASPTALGPFVEGPAPVLRSPSNSFGAGQLDDPPPKIRELWHWRENVAGAVARLRAFRADARIYQIQVQQGLPWDAATGTLEPAPPGEGDEHLDAPPFTTDQLDLEMWARYNSGRRYHDWNGLAWVRQPSDSPGVTKYAPELLEMRRRVDAGDFPDDW